MKTTFKFLKVKEDVPADLTKYDDYFTINIDGEDVTFNEGEMVETQLGRSDSFVTKISKLMKKSFEAGKSGEEFDFEIVRS